MAELLCVQQRTRDSGSGGTKRPADDALPGNAVASHQQQVQTMHSLANSSLVPTACAAECQRQATVAEALRRPNGATCR